MKSSHAPVHQIELRIVALSELFNSMDPTPFQHRDLDRDAVEFLESWALEFPPASHFRIIVHIEEMPPDDPTPLVSEAMRNYFDYKSVLALRNLRLLKESLLIGGWVAMWRPLQIFLYDWWPVMRRRRIYRNLGHASVQVLPATLQSGLWPSRSGSSPAHAVPARAVHKDGHP